MVRKVSRRELAEHFQVTETTISNWQRDGMPVHARKRGPLGNLYDVEDCEAWRSPPTLSAEEAKEQRRYDYNAERARLAHHQANIAELDAEERRHSLWPTDVVERMFGEVVGAARARLLAIDGKLRNRVPDMDERAYQLVETLIREALDELSSEGFPDAIRAGLAEYHDRLAATAQDEPESVGDETRHHH